MKKMLLLAALMLFNFSAYASSFDVIEQTSESDLYHFHHGNGVSYTLALCKSSTNCTYQRLAGLVVSNLDKIDLENGVILGEIKGQSLLFKGLLVNTFSKSQTDEIDVELRFTEVDNNFSDELKAAWGDVLTKLKSIEKNN